MNPSSLHFPLWRRSPPNRAAFESSHGCAVDVGADTGLPSPIQQVQETRTFTLFVYGKSREQGRPHAIAIVDPHRRPSLLPRRRRIATTSATPSLLRRRRVRCESLSPPSLYFPRRIVAVVAVLAAPPLGPRTTAPPRVPACRPWPRLLLLRMRPLSCALVLLLVRAAAQLAPLASPRRPARLLPPCCWSPTAVSAR